MIRKQGYVIADNEKERDNKSFFDSVIDNDHLLPNQFIPSLVV